ncbi:OmpA family protein [Arcobacter sp. LA11]|uniref:OmpA family protein n=1 Tax=Arcobacter sp. LA11 TaxID=1898176 RepID=UPI00093307A8|nr:OmpA family protein [Arcobacter sp. LA11]
MKKLSIYTFLVAAVLFTGCSQKEVEVSQPETTPKNSETMLNNIDNSNIQNEMVNDALVESAENGYYYMINGKKEFIENIYFGFDKYSLNADTKAIAKSNAMKLSGVQSGTTIKVEGNCDEWGTDEYNYALGLKRAKVVKDSLVMEGIASSAVTVVSFGESNPVCTDKNASCWQKNRRSEHKLVK